MTIYRDDLVEAYKLIENPQTWCRHGFYDDGKYCLIGAWRHVCGGYANGIEACWTSDREFSRALGLQEFGDAAAFRAYKFNDEHGHSEVLALLKSAIDRAPVRP